MATTPRSFLDLYLYTAGKSEVPTIWHEWGCFSLLAACVNDAVWYEKFKGEKLYPNLYLAIVGPSGSGKGIAMGHASRFVKGNKSVFRYRGKLSGAGLADILARKEAHEASWSGERPTVWLVLPELASSVGTGNLANDFIKRLTDVFNGEADIYREATRTMIADGRDIEYQLPLVNTFFGSTVEWLIECVTKDAIASGFFARMLVIDGRFDPNVRVTDPTFPSDVDAVVDELKQRIKSIQRLEGVFALDDKAAALRDRWYQNRPVPDDDRMLPLWKRADDLILKLAMILSPVVQFGVGDKVITGSAWRTAHNYVREAERSLPMVMRQAARAEQTGNLEAIADMIRKAGRLPHTAALKKANHRGIHAVEFKMHIEALKGRGDVGVDRTATGAKVYEWVAT